MTNRISVLIPTYNRPDYLIQALDSVLEQTLQPFEIIISDDNINSNKNLDILKSYLEKYPFIKYHKNTENLGGAKNYKKLLELANGEYIKWLADDDLLLPTALEKMSHQLDNNKNIALVTSVRVAKTPDLSKILEAGNLESIYDKDTLVNGKEFSKKTLVDLVNYVGEFSTVLFRKDSIENMDLFKLDNRVFKANSDWLLWLKLMSKNDIFYITEPLSIFRISFGMEQMDLEMQITGLYELVDFVFGDFTNKVFELSEVEKEKQIAKLVAYIRHNIDDLIRKNYKNKVEILFLINYFYDKFTPFLEEISKNKVFYENMLYVNSLLEENINKLKNNISENDFIPRMLKYKYYLQKDKLEQAEQELENVIRVYDSNNDWVYQLANLKYKLDKYEEAIDLYSNLIDKEYKNKKIYLEIAECLKKIEENETAQEFISIYNNFNLTEENDIKNIKFKAKLPNKNTLELSIDYLGELNSYFYYNGIKKELKISTENFALNLPDKTCDEINIIIETTKYCNNDKLKFFFKECFRVLKDNGNLEINIPNEYYTENFKSEILSVGLKTKELISDKGIITTYLIKLEFSNELPLVSLVMPTYKPQYLTKALNSLVNQTYKNIEIIISDNCPTEEIKDIIDLFSNFQKITYYRNPEKYLANFQKCFDMANGKYVKFLLDDDILAPNCVEKMVTYFEAYENSVSLVTSKRHKIDELGNRLSDDSSTVEIALNDTIFNKFEIGNFMLNGLVNVVGELSTAMFRKKDLINEKPHFFSFLSIDPYSNIDMSCWINLLTKGNLAYISEPLSFFRTNPYQNTHNSLPASLVEWFDLIEESRKVGFLDNTDLYKHTLNNLIQVFDYHKSTITQKEKLDVINEYYSKIINRLNNI
ncbi:MAG: glycosyltransferase [Candidatus Sericytochromatia bacterium]